MGHKFVSQAPLVFKDINKNLARSFLGGIQTSKTTKPQLKQLSQILEASTAYLRISFVRF